MTGKTGHGGSHPFANLRSPAGDIIGKVHGPKGEPANARVGTKVNLKPAIAANTMRPEIKTGAAKVRSAHSGGRVIKPW
jgi:hypothetical protein